jgi:glycosyltransferase involved in cell wall biosynthesis
MSDPPAPAPDTELPLVSIITPSFNQAAFLSETLRSVASQDYPRIEHIVMDGGSTDGSAEIIRRWARTHAIVWRSHRDEGQADAIRQGAELASGDIIAWLNSDDVYLDPSVVSDVVAVFRSGARIVTGGGWYIDEEGRRLEHIAVRPERIIHETLRYVDWILQPATFVERALFLSCPLDTSLRFAFDWDFFIRLTALAPATPIHRDLAGYRRHREGKTISGGGRRQRELLEVTRRYHGRLSAPYLVLSGFVVAHLVAERLPPDLYARAERLLHRLADLIQRATRGRGIQY